MIDFILYFLISFITISLVVLCFKKYSQEQIVLNKWLYVILFGGSLITTGLYYIDITILKTIYSFLFFIIVFKYISKKSIVELIYYAIFIWLYGMAIDIFIMLLISLLGIDVILNNFPLIYARIISSVLMAVLYLLIAFIPVIQKFTKKTIDKILKIKTSIIIEIFFVLVLIILNAVCVINISKISTQVLVLIIVSLLAYAIYSSIDKNYNIKKFKQLNDILIKNNDFFIKMDTDHRILKHNLISQLLGIKTVANKKAQLLIDDLISSYNQNFVSSQDIKKIPVGINGMVYEKLYSFNKSDINLAVENSVKSNFLDVLKPRNYNKLCEILGVLVDNALEASNESLEKSILIDFSEAANYISVKVINTFNNNLNIDELGYSKYSSKSESRGLGIFSIINKRDIVVNTSIVNNLYQCEVKIKKVLYK